MRVRAAVILVAVAAVVAGCSGHGGSPPKAAPTTLAVTTLPTSTTTTTIQAASTTALKAAAQAVLSAYATGNWGSFWDHWDPTSQALISRAEYIRRKTACPGIIGVPITIMSVQPAANGVWNVVGKAVGPPITYQFRYLQARWVYVITDPAVKAQLIESFATYIARPGCTK